MQFLGRTLHGIREVYVFGPTFESYWNLVPDSSIHNSRSLQKLENLESSDKMKHHLAEGYKKQDCFFGKEFKE